MKFVVITGMSGGGRTTALKLLEDNGFYCVDNLPLSLLHKFVELITIPNSEIENVALGIDVRTSQSFGGVSQILQELKSKGYKYEILFMDAADNVLLRRYKESRRAHPMAPAERIETGIMMERELLTKIKREADYVIDTSTLLNRELKEELEKIFIDNSEYKNLIATVLSFGFKNGVPQDADLVFDVRFLPNPFYIEELKKQTGNNKAVQDYVMSFDEANIFLEKMIDMLEFLVPNYIKEGKNRLVIAIGCTGGKHRSVTLANKVYDRIKGSEICAVTIQHRDIIIGR